MRSPLSRAVVELYPVYSLHIKVARLLAENVTALLKARGQSQHDLAHWCRKTDVWVSQFLHGKRLWQLDDLDRIADFFGLATYQLLQPGISPLTERRVGDRRSGRERRIGHQLREVQALAAAARINVGGTTIPSGGRSHGAHIASSPVAAALIKLTADYERRVHQLISQAELGGQTPAPRPSRAKPRPRGRASGGSNAETA